MWVQWDRCPFLSAFGDSENSFGINWFIFSYPVRFVDLLWNWFVFPIIGTKIGILYSFWFISWDWCHVPLWPVLHHFVQKLFLEHIRAQNRCKRKEIILLLRTNLTTSMSNKKFAYLFLSKKAVSSVYTRKSMQKF